MTNSTSRTWNPKSYDELTFEVGDRVHFSIGTDILPGTVVKVSRSHITVREDKSEADPSFIPEFIPGGFAGHVVNNHNQKRIIEEDLDGVLLSFTRRLPPKHIREYHGIPDGRGWRYVGTGLGTWQRGAMLLKGWRAFYAYNF